MLNESFVLYRIEPYLNANREISEFEFLELFATGEYPLTLHEQYDVIKIMIAHNIYYVDEKDEETKTLTQSSTSEKIIDQKDIASLMNLKNEQLCVMAQKNDEMALAALIQKNQRFIHQKALKLLQQFSKISHTEDDLFQEGVLGMMEAVSRFDPAKEFSFLTYAWSWVHNRMERAIVNNGFTVRLPVHVYEKILKVQRYRRENPDATADIISEMMCKDGFNYQSQDVREYLNYGEQYLNTASLNVLIGDGDTELQSLLPNDDEISVEDQVIENLLKTELAEKISALKQRESTVILLRFGFYENRTYTLEEIAKIFGLTRERIRQIEVKALKRLRKRVKSF